MTTTETKTFNSPSASAFRRGAYTDEEGKLAIALNHAGVPFTTQREFSTGKIIPRNGLVLCYTVDFKVGDKLIVEVVGEGSSSDDPDRHAYFVGEGFEVLYASNKSVNASPSLVADWIRCHWLMGMMRETAKLR